MENKNNTKLAVAYCRVSTEEQANKGLSLDAQEEACLNEIKKDGFKVLKVIRDKGKSAGSLKRPGIQEVIKLVTEQRIRAVYTINRDRMARNTMNHLYLRDLFSQNNVELRYIYEPMGDNSAMSMTMDTVMASFNEMQRLVTKEKTKNALDAKARAGYMPTTAPLGYKNVSNPDAGANKMAQRIIVLEPETAPLVKEMFKRYAMGDYNGYELIELMHHKGLRAKRGKMLTLGRLYEILKNRFYIGEVHWANIHLEKGQHEPLIDKETFNRVQSVLASHSHHACRRRKYSWLLNGFIRCARHGKRYTAEWHLHKKLAYYHCTNRFGCGKYIRIEKLEQMVAEKFQELEFNPEFVERIINKVKAVFYNRRKEYEGKRQALINQRAAYEAQLKTAEDKLLTKVISDEDFTRIRKENKTKINDIEDKIMELENKKEVRVDIVQEILRFTGNIFNAYTKASPTLKRHYLAFFWERFEVADGIIIKSVPSPIFDELLRLEQVYVKTKITKKTNRILDNSEVIITPNWGA